MDNMFDFEDDDITDSMTVEDFQLLEKEAWQKAEEKSGVDSKKTNNVSYTKDNGTTSNEAGNSTRPRSTRKEVLVGAGIDEFIRKVKELESKLSGKESELQVVRNNLDARRRELNEKNVKIAELTKQQDQKRTERDCKLAQEVQALKTKLSFQEHELNKLEMQRLQSQKVPNSPNGCNNYQRVSSSKKGSQIVTHSVKRKAEVSGSSHGFDLENSFNDSQTSCYKIPKGKVPRLEAVGNNRGKQSRSPEMKPSLLRKLKTDKVAKPREPTASKESATSRSMSNNNQQPELKINMSERKACNLIRELVLSHSCDASLNDGSDFETVSLLTLLKFPLKHLPAVLKKHSVNASQDLSLSQFPNWQTQVQAALSDSDEELDFDSGKYNLVSQGMFLLLNLLNLSEQNVDTLGVMHVLVFLELYITSYLLTRQRIDEHDSKTESDPKNLRQETATAREDATGSGVQKVLYDDQDMILQTLQILKLLFYSTPGLVKCVLDKTSPTLFRKDTANDDVIVISDSDEVKPKGEENNNEDNLSTEMSEDNAAVGSFRSLLLQNLCKLVPLPNDNPSLSVCHAAFKVLIAMTSLCDNQQLERMFIPLNRGCLVELLAKGDCAMPTVSLVMSLITNFLPCQDVHSMVCSRTDDCILLKIYQCACEEEDYYGSDEMCREFLVQFFQFLARVAASHYDSIEFLLESDCQCSFEIIRCLVLVLYDKVKYLLDLDIEHVTSHDSLPIVRAAINILVTLCTHACYSPDHKLHVEHEFTELIYACMDLYKNIKSCITEHQALALQDLLDMENIYEIDWSSGSDDDDEEDMVLS